MTPALDPVRLDALRKLAEAATPYMWEIYDDTGWTGSAWHSREDARRRADEAGYKIRPLYLDLPDTTLALLAERAAFLARIAELEAERDELQAVFDGTWKADQRAIKRWQAANPGNDLVWPDRADMVVWLLGREAELEADRDQFLAALADLDAAETAFRETSHDAASIIGAEDRIAEAIVVAVRCRRALLPKASVREERG